MKVLALVFAVAVVALLIGMVSPVAAPGGGGDCSGGGCRECAQDGPGKGGPAQCYVWCVTETSCPGQPSYAICFHGCNPDI